MKNRPELVIEDALSFLHLDGHREEVTEDQVSEVYYDHFDDLEDQNHADAVQTVVNYFFN